MPGWTRRAAAVLVLAVVGLVIVTTRQAPALRLVDSSPADAQVLASRPGEVRLTFSVEVTPALSHVAVTDRDGRAVTTGPATTGGPAGVLSVPVTLPEDAAYTISYHVAGAGGEQADGVIRFAVGGPLAEEAAAPGHEHGHGVDPLSAMLLLINLLVVVVVAVLLISRPPPVRHL